MRTLIHFQNRTIPVYYKSVDQRALLQLKDTLEKKMRTGKTLLKSVLNSLISIEIKGGEAILHTFSENNALVLSLY